MFGYVRPLKNELLVRELARYRSVYCGICKSVSRDYGQVPRLTVGYDVTLLGLLLLALADDQPPVGLETCVLNPFQKKPIVQGGAVIERCAALSVLLGYHKAQDNRRDGRQAAGLAASALLRPAYRKARRRFPESDLAIRSRLERLAACEQGPPDPEAAVIFGELLAELMREAVADSHLGQPVRDALVLLAGELGAWIYICDAIDDLKDDCNNGNWNPFSGLEPDRAREIAGARMQAAEKAMDRTAALLPYTRDGGIVANVVTLGLPAIRETVFAGGRPGRL